jgi:hypothetical protein
MYLLKFELQVRVSRYLLVKGGIIYIITGVTVQNAPNHVR